MNDAFDKASSNKKKIILNFIKQHNLGVIATTDSDKPEAAVIEYGETENFELIFDTYIASRKYQNLQKNPKTAFVIGWDENITVQYEGEAYELKGEELNRFKEIYFMKNSRAKAWESVKGITYFKVIPKKIKYSDLNKHPWEVFEINL